MCLSVRVCGRWLYSSLFCELKHFKHWHLHTMCTLHCESKNKTLNSFHGVYGIFKHDFFEFTSESASDKNWKSVNIWGSYGQQFSVLFFWLTEYIWQIAITSNHYVFNNYLYRYDIIVILSDSWCIDIVYLKPNIF